MHLIDDWKQAHRWWSVQAGFACIVLNGVLIGLGAFMDYLNPWLFMGLNIAGYATVGVLRLIKQGDPRGT